MDAAEQIDFSVSDVNLRGVVAVDLDASLRPLIQSHRHVTSVNSCMRDTYVFVVAVNVALLRAVCEMCVGVSRMPVNICPSDNGAGRNVRGRADDMTPMAKVKAKMAEKRILR